MFAKRPELLAQSPEALQTKLDILLAYNVDIESILRAPLTFEMSSTALSNQLEELKKLKLDKIKSYMIDEPISTTIAMKENQEKKKSMLGEFKGSTLEYISSRLGWTEEQAEEAIRSTPAIAKISAKKVRHFLSMLMFFSYVYEITQDLIPNQFVGIILQAKSFVDFILTETHFTGLDVLDCTRVFSHKVDESRARYNELTSLGFKPDHLRIFAFDRKRYIKHIRCHCEKSRKKDIWDRFLVIEKRVKEKQFK